MNDYLRSDIRRVMRVRPRATAYYKKHPEIVSLLFRATPGLDVD